MTLIAAPSQKMKCKFETHMSNSKYTDQRTFIQCNGTLKKHIFKIQVKLD
jgi:hypothetical protein